MPTVAIEGASLNQRERLWQIDFLARFRGQVTRHDLVRRFGIALSNATRDFTLYRQLAPQNLDYDHREKVYRPSLQFQPLFSYDREHTLQALTLGQGVGFEACEQAIVVNAPLDLNHPDLDILGAVSRAIYGNKVLEVRYVSVGSGESIREVVPHSLVNTGSRWHVRAYCRTQLEFRDFVLTRIVSAAQQASDVDLSAESISQDKDWNQSVKLELIPHPRAEYPRAVELDYGLSPGQSIEVTLRAATAGYFLRRWGVDCSETSILSPSEYQLALRNPSEVRAKIDLSIAPGFSKGGNI